MKRRHNPKAKARKAYYARPDVRQPKPKRQANHPYTVRLSQAWLRAIAAVTGEQL